MLRSIIQWSVDNRLLVTIAAVAVIGAGGWAMATTPVDAIPDLSDVQVIVETEWPGQAPQIIEDQITYPLSTELLKVPNARYVRGISQFGRSFVYVIFEDDVDMYWARSRVLEYLSGLADELPEQVRPQLGPDATGVGWVMQYVLLDHGGTLDNAELRSLQDWTIRYQLTAVPGGSSVSIRLSWSRKVCWCTASRCSRSHARCGSRIRMSVDGRLSWAEVSTWSGEWATSARSRTSRQWP